MQVYPPVNGHCQHVRGHEAAVGDNDAEIRLHVVDALRDVGGLQGCCLQQFDAGFGGYFSHR